MKWTWANNPRNDILFLCRAAERLLLELEQPLKSGLVPPWSQVRVSSPADVCLWSDHHSLAEPRKIEIRLPEQPHLAAEVHYFIGLDNDCSFLFCPYAPSDKTTWRCILIVKVLKLLTKMGGYKVFANTEIDVIKCQNWVLEFRSHLSKIHEFLARLM